MLSRLSSHIRHNVVGYLALFFALSGTALGASALNRGDPAGGDLSGTYPNPSIAPNAVNSAKVSNDSLTADDLAAGSVGTSELANGAVTPAKLNVGLAFTDAGLPDAPGAFCPPTPPAGGWVNPDPEHRVAYARDPFGIVHLHGLARSCGGGAILQLPQGFRPGGLGPIDLPAVVGETAENTVIQISFAGNVTSFSPDGDAVFLDGLTFRCSPSGQDGCP